MMYGSNEIRPFQYFKFFIFFVAGVVLFYAITTGISLIALAPEIEQVSKLKKTFGFECTFQIRCAEKLRGEKNIYEKELDFNTCFQHLESNALQEILENHNRVVDLLPWWAFKSHLHEKCMIPTYPNQWAEAEL